MQVNRHASGTLRDLEPLEDGVPGTLLGQILILGTAGAVVSAVSLADVYLLFVIQVYIHGRTPGAAKGTSRERI